MPIYNQDVVIDQLNRYLQLNHRHKKLKYGYCHGFTLLWLYKMSHGQEDWFYNTIQRLIDCKTKKDFDAISADVETFLAHLEWLQNSDTYVNDIHQLDVDKVLDYHRDISLSFLFSHKQLNEVLEKVILEKKIITISGPNHTIGVFRREGKFYIFDPNYNEGLPKIMEDVNTLKDEIINCHFHGKRLPGHRIPIEINVAHDPADGEDPHADKMEIFGELLSETSHLDKPGFSNVTNLFMACESGDAQEVALLLKKGANPNQISNNDWTPLQMAASKGYADIVTLLLNSGAVIQQADAKDITPLYLAASNGHFQAAKLLLDAGAQATSGKHTGNAPLHAAIRSDQWEIVLLMLSRIGNMDLISRYDLDAIRDHRQRIAFTLKNHWDNFTASEKFNINNVLDRVYHAKYPDTFFTLPIVEVATPLPPGPVRVRRPYRSR